MALRATAKSRRALCQALGAAQEMEKMAGKYNDITDRAYREFTDVADYIWKSPKLIRHETELETQKIKDYFPKDEE